MGAWLRYAEKFIDHCKALDTAKSSLKNIFILFHFEQPPKMASTQFNWI